MLPPATGHQFTLSAETIGPRGEIYKVPPRHECRDSDLGFQYVYYTPTDSTYVGTHCGNLLLDAPDIEPYVGGYVQAVAEFNGLTLGLGRPMEANLTKEVQVIGLPDGATLYLSATPIGIPDPVYESVFDHWEIDTTDPYVSRTANPLIRPGTARDASYRAVFMIVRRDRGGSGGGGDDKCIDCTQDPPPGN